jgi:hypothetical protein
MSIRRTDLETGELIPFFLPFGTHEVVTDTDSRIFESNVADVVTRDE